MEELESGTVSSTAHESFSESVEEESAGFDSTPDGSGAQPARRWLRLLRDVAETVILTVVIFVAINLVTGRFRVEGPSMRPNLSEGQYLIINKIVYKFNSPGRGDIIVFHHPRDSGRDLIKRVIGLPGETVEIREGRVYVNGALLEEPYVSRTGRYSGEYELGSSEYFVLGDNRPNSDDSHNWGVLKEEKIVGKAWISYWPPDEWGGVPHFNFPKSPVVQRHGQRLSAGIPSVSSGE